MLGGCSEYYFDRRDGITLHSGEAMAANRVTQMIDPWPAASGNRNIAYNGEKAAVAAERYRTGRVIPPVNAPPVRRPLAAQQQASPRSRQAPPAVNAGANNTSTPTK